MRFLLDVNVLVALAFPRHVHHQRAHAWFLRDQNREWATCPLTQAGFLRVAYQGLSGANDSIRQALAGFEEVCRSPHHEFWPVDADLRDLSDSQRSRLIGPNQVADMQLLLLAHRRHGQFATFDTGLRTIAAGTPFAASLLAI